jgi:uncharacterized protein with LGFP repeats
MKSKLINYFVAIILANTLGTSMAYSGVCPFADGVIAINDHVKELSETKVNVGQPTTDFFVVPGKNGCGRHYSNKFSVYWNKKTGLAKEVHGHIRDKWEKLGWEKGIKGFPITDELTTNDGKGRFNHFENGSIYWHPDVGGAFEVHGAIQGKWADLGYEGGLLGYPITDELKTRDGSGKYNHFQNGSIFYHPQFGAFEVHGDIRAYWSNKNWESGYLGFPVSDELKTPCNSAGRYNKFQRGYVVWHPEHGTHMIPKGLRDYWIDVGGFCGSFGLPISEPECAGGQCRQQFEGGSLEAPGW